MTKLTSTIYFLCAFYFLPLDNAGEGIMTLFFSGCLSAAFFHSIVSLDRLLLYFSSLIILPQEVILNRS